MILILTHNSADSDIVRATVNSLIELRIMFKGYLEQEVDHVIPDNLEEYPAAIVGNGFLRDAAPEERARLEAYSRTHVVQIMDDIRYPGIHNPVYVDEPYAELDTPVFINCFAAAAGLGGDVFPPLPQQVIMNGMMTQIRYFFETNKDPQTFGEYHHHMMYSALAIESSPYAPEDITRLINDFLDVIFTSGVNAGHCDAIQALGFAPLYAQRMHISKYQKEFEDVLNNLLKIRCRTPQGLLGFGGSNDDPLAMRSVSDFRRIGPFNTNYLRNVTCNDILTFYEILASGTSYTGNPVFFEEFWKIFEYIKKVHQDKDGLFFYASRDSIPCSGKWCRGQGHATNGIYHALLNYPEMPEDRKKALIQCLDEIGHGLIATQREDGRWSTVLDNPTTQGETSSTVLFTYVYAGACNRGWLNPDTYREMITKSRAALLTRFWHGRGVGNCRGTMPSFHAPDFLAHRPQHMFVMPFIAPALVESDKMLAQN